MAKQKPKHSSRLKALTVVAVVFAGMLYLQAQDKPAATTVPVRMTVTATPLNDKAMPELSRDDIMVKQGKERLKVTDWTPARGDLINERNFAVQTLLDDPVYSIKISVHECSDLF